MPRPYIHTVMMRQLAHLRSVYDTIGEQQEYYYYPLRPQVYERILHMFLVCSLTAPCVRGDGGQEEGRFGRGVGLVISEEQKVQYWDHVKRYCPWADNAELDGSHIPLTLYGDSARYGQGFDQSKVTGCYMSINLWRPRSTRMSQ